MFYSEDKFRPAQSTCGFLTGLMFDSFWDHPWNQLCVAHWGKGGGKVGVVDGALKTVIYEFLSNFRSPLSTETTFFSM